MGLHSEGSQVRGLTLTRRLALLSYIILSFSLNTQMFVFCVLSQERREKGGEFEMKVQTAIKAGSLATRWSIGTN